MLYHGHFCASPQAAQDGNWWHGERIVFPTDLLQDGDNTIQLTYTNLFDHGGDGFHQFVDPQDGEEYLYVDKHTLFPCSLSLSLSLSLSPSDCALSFCPLMMLVAVVVACG
jgi:hypothetical protein